MQFGKRGKREIGLKGTARHYTILVKWANNVLTDITMEIGSNGLVRNASIIHDNELKSIILN